MGLHTRAYAHCLYTWACLFTRAYTWIYTHRRMHMGVCTWASHGPIHVGHAHGCPHMSHIPISRTSFTHQAFLFELSSVKLDSLPCLGSIEPTSGPVGGGTTIVVSGPLIAPHTLRWSCLFGAKLTVPATYDASLASLSCVTPGYGLHSYGLHGYGSI